MKILLYSCDLEEQDVVDKLFVYLYQFLLQERTVRWFRRKALDLLPSEEVCTEIDLKIEFLQYLLFYYVERKFRSEITEILWEFWNKPEDDVEENDKNVNEKQGLIEYLFVDLSESDAEFIDGMLPVLHEIEFEMKKINPDSEVITAFPDDIYDNDIVDGFEITWKNVELCKL